MSQERDFLKAIMTDLRAKDLIKKIKRSTDEEMAEEYVRVADKLGFSISKEKFLQLFKLKAKHQQNEAQKAEEEVKTALDKEDLDVVAGGDSVCYDTYVAGENCYFTDQCNIILLSYSDQPAVPVDYMENGDDCMSGHITVIRDDGWNIWIEDQDELPNNPNNGNWDHTWNDDTPENTFI